jgi:hypothetical protein
MMRTTAVSMVEPTTAFVSQTTTTRLWAGTRLAKVTSKPETKIKRLISHLLT